MKGDNLRHIFRDAKPLQPGWSKDVPDPSETATLEVEIHAGRVTLRYQESALAMPVYVPVYVPALKGIMGAILSQEAAHAVLGRSVTNGDPGAPPPTPPAPPGIQ